MHFVYIQMRTAFFHKIVCQVKELMLGKIHVVGCDVETMVFWRVLNTLQDHCRLADTSRTEYSHQTTVPTNIIILIAHEFGGHLPQHFVHVLKKFQFNHSLITLD